MKNRTLTLISALIPLFIIYLFFGFDAYAQTPSPKQKTIYYRAKAVKIIEEGTKKIGNTYNPFQTIEIIILEGPDKDETVFVEHGGLVNLTEEQKIQPNDTLILTKSVLNGEVQYGISDKYRLNNLFFIFCGFFLLVMLMAGKKGLGSFVGMLISLCVIMFFIIPQILNGANPLFICLIGAVLIMIGTLYLAHGFSAQTTVAVISTAISLVAAIALSLFLVKLTKLSGLGSEDIYSLTLGFSGKIQFQGLLLGSIIIGTLGVLDDVTTTQTATIIELADANPKYGLKTLFIKGMRIGREHIISLVNTLILAYAGSSMGVFIYLIFAVKEKTQPLWVILNSELIMEEVIRALAGSSSLILAVPLTTLLAAFFTRYSLKIR